MNSLTEDSPEKTPRPIRIRWRRILFLLFLLFVLFFFTLLPRLLTRGLNDTGDFGPYKVSAEARALHARCQVADLHADSLLWSRDLLERGTYGHVDVPRLIEGGVALQAFTIVTKVPLKSGFKDQPVPPDVTVRMLVMSQRWPLATWSSLKERALYQARRLHTLAERSQERFRVITNKRQLAEYLAARKRDPKMSAGFLGIEGLHCLEGKLENVDALFAAGVRMMAPTHFFDTELGGSAHGTTGAGLSDFGRQVIERMEERGILIDVAHASPALLADLLKLARTPVISSHTGVRGTHDSVRNLSDEQLRGIAKTGGVVGIAFFKEATGGEDVAAVIKAIQYAVELIGADHVALGSDFDGSVKVPIHCGGLAKITEGLMAAGMSARDIQKVMGGNVMRVLARTLPATPKKK